MTLENLIKEQKATIIDVRETFEHQMQSVNGAINIPIGEIPEKIEEIKAMKRPLVFHCASGGRSGQAVSFLQGNGVEDIYNGGGISSILMATGQF